MDGSCCSTFSRLLGATAQLGGSHIGAAGAVAVNPTAAVLATANALRVQQLTCLLQPFAEVAFASVWGSARCGHGSL